MKSQSSEDYLKAIYLLQEQQSGGPVSTSSLAAALGIADPSVTGMLKRMAAANPSLIVYEPYAGATLTLAGERQALEIIRHHRLIETFLSQALGYSWDEVHEEAERLEHVISETMEERMASALGNPTTDPHGDPIPDRDGRFAQPRLFSLTELAEGQAAEVRRVTAQDSGLLRYLSELGLNLSAQIRVVARAPFNGPVSVAIPASSSHIQALSHEVAQRILVEPLDEASGAER